MTLGTWSGVLNLFIIPMDYFKMIFGNELFNKVHAFPLPTTNSFSIVN